MDYKLILFFLLPILSLHSQSVEVITIDWKDFEYESDATQQCSVEIKSNVRHEGIYLTNDKQNWYFNMELIANDPDLEQELWPEIFKDKWLWTKNEDRWKYTKKLGKDELIEVFLGEGYKVVSDTEEDFKRDSFSIYRYKNKGTVRLSKNIEKKAEETAVSDKPLRTFTASDGRPLKAHFIEMVDSKVFLEMPNGFKITIPLTRFSEADQEFFKNGATE